MVLARLWRRFGRSTERKVLCSIGSGPHAELLAIAGETYRAFADRHGYELDLRTELLDSSRPASWSKVLLIQELLAKFDTVLWVDADAAFVNIDRDIADDVGARYLGMSVHHYDGQAIPNAAIMLLRRSRMTTRFLAEVWNAVKWIDHPWWENAAILELMGHEVGDGPGPVVMKSPTPYYRKAALLGNEWNSILVDEAEQPRIRHYPGRSQEHRLEHLHRDLEELRTGIAI